MYELGQIYSEEKSLVNMFSHKINNTGYRDYHVTQNGGCVFMVLFKKKLKKDDFEESFELDRDFEKYILNGMTFEFSRETF